MRRAHYLSGNKAVEGVQHAIWFDTETDPKKVVNDSVEHWLKFGYAAYRRRLGNGKWSAPDWLRFTDSVCFWEWVSSRIRSKTHLWLFCHNTSFDLPVLGAFRSLPGNGWTLKTAIIDAPPTILRYRKGNSSLTICDTLNIWKMPLAEIGRHVGLDKLPMPKPGADPAEWESYGKRDVEILMQACLSWWEWLRANDMGGFSATLASQSMRVYRHKFLRVPITIDDCAPALELARNAYHGGRCECFKIGSFEGDFYLLDVNSMYPAVMAKYSMPTRLQSVTRRVTVSEIGVLLDRFALVGLFQLETPTPFAAVYHQGKLIFPTGLFETYLTTPDIRYALKHGYIRTVRQLAVYEQADLFHDFVKTMYAARQEAEHRGDSVQAWQFKILLNSFYGKWGQRGRQWKNCDTADPSIVERRVTIDYETRKMEVTRTFGGIVQLLVKERESYDSHPAIAAHITAYARHDLFQLIERAKRENCLYADTDSLMVTRQGFERLADLVNDNELGKLKVQGRYNRVKLYGCKDYQFDNLVRIKGIRKNAVEIAPLTFEQELWVSLRGLLRDGHFRAPVTRMIRKRLRRVYDKGIVTDSGTVTPFHLPCVEEAGIFGSTFSGSA